jgi:hypothetical protein
LIILFINVKYLNIYSKRSWKTIKVRYALWSNYLLMIKSECKLCKGGNVLFVDAIVWSDIDIGPWIKIELLSLAIVFYMECHGGSVCENISELLHCFVWILVCPY